MIAIFPKIAECAEAGDPERLAVLVRSYFGGEGKFAPKLDIDHLYKQIGIPIKWIAIDGVAALSAKDEKGRFRLVACLNPQTKLTPSERSFTLAHLLGHYYFHIQPKILRGDWARSGIKEDICPELRYGTLGYGSEGSWDRDADRFAIALLLPKALVMRAAQKFLDSQDMAKFFGINIKVLIRRTVELGCALDDMPQIELRSPTSPAHLVQESTLNSSKEGAVSPSKIESSPNKARGWDRIRQIARDLDRHS